MKRIFGKPLVMFGVVALLLSGCVWAWQEGVFEPAESRLSQSQSSELGGLDPRDVQFNPIRFEAPGKLRQNWVRVVRVVDGDTVRVVVDGKEEAVRLIGINSPELMNTSKKTTQNDPGGYEAAKWLEDRLARDAQVRLEYDVEKRDRYSRLLAYLWVSRDVGSEADGHVAGDPEGEALLNHEIVRMGHAAPVYYRPNGKYRARLEAAAK